MEQFLKYNGDRESVFNFYENYPFPYTTLSFAQLGLF